MLLFTSLLKELDIQFLLTKNPNQESFIIEIDDIDSLIKHLLIKNNGSNNNNGRV
jgi:hypothetical protein